VTPVLLWWAWRDESDRIPNHKPAILPNAKDPPTFRCNCCQLYDITLLLCTAIQLLATRTISMAQAHIGQQFLAKYCRCCLQANISLTINHHASMHTVDMIKRFGSVYSWWLFAFECFNGMLEHVDHNGHNGGYME
ncbi:hypothetical protein BS17DRAFT_678328, partial [Gyrodon lividus]